MKTLPVVLALLFFAIASQSSAQSLSGYIPPGTLVTALVTDDNVTSAPPDWRVSQGECYLYVKVDEVDSSMCVVQVGNTAVRAKATDFRVVTDSEVPQAVAKYKQEIADDQANFPSLQLGVGSQQPQAASAPSGQSDGNTMGVNRMPSRAEIEHIGRMFRKDAAQKRAQGQNPSQGKGPDAQSSPSPSPRSTPGTATIDGKKFRLPTQAEINKALILSQKAADPYIVPDQAPQPKATPAPAATPFSLDSPN